MKTMPEGGHRHMWKSSYFLLSFDIGALRGFCSLISGFHACLWSFHISHVSSSAKYGSSRGFLQRSMLHFSCSRVQYLDLGLAFLACEITSSHLASYRAG